MSRQTEVLLATGRARRAALERSPLAKTSHRARTVPQVGTTTTTERRRPITILPKTARCVPRANTKSVLGPRCARTVLQGDTTATTVRMLLIMTRWIIALYGIPACPERIYLQMAPPKATGPAPSAPMEVFPRSKTGTVAIDGKLALLDNTFLPMGRLKTTGTAHCARTGVFPSLRTSTSVLCGKLACLENIFLPMERLQATKFAPFVLMENFPTMPISSSVSLGKLAPLGNSLLRMGLPNRTGIVPSALMTDFPKRKTNTSAIDVQMGDIPEPWGLPQLPTGTITPPTAIPPPALFASSQTTAPLLET